MDHLHDQESYAGKSCQVKMDAPIFIFQSRQVDSKVQETLQLKKEPFTFIFVDKEDQFSSLTQQSLKIEADVDVKSELEIETKQELRDIELCHENFEKGAHFELKNALTESIQETNGSTVIEKEFTTFYCCEQDGSSINPTSPTVVMTTGTRNKGALKQRGENSSARKESGQTSEMTPCRKQTAKQMLQHVGCNDSSEACSGQSNQHQLEKNDDEKPFGCDQCSKMYSRYSSLWTHRLIHKGVKSFKCDECGKAFAVHYRLKRHQTFHKGEKLFQCSVCNMRFTTKSSLKIHLIIHTENKRPFECDICGKKYTQPSHLKRHKRKHSGERPYTCDFCSKSFSCRTNLTRHTKIHKRETPHGCDMCDKTFFTSSMLKKHKSSHPEFKPYSCEVCNARFALKSRLFRHLNVHTGGSLKRPSQCHLCGKTFNDIGGYKSHIEVHSGEKPYHCEVCGKAFNTRRSMIRHKGLIHKIDKQSLMKSSLCGFQC